MRACRDAERRERVASLAALAPVRLLLRTVDTERASGLEALGFGAFDALHLASAERGKVHTFLTTDDSLLRRARRLRRMVHVSVKNPLEVLLEIQGQ